MKTGYKLISIIVLVSALIFFRWIKQPAAINVSDTAEIVVGTSADFPPFSFIDTSGDITGFDKDLIDEIFKRMNRSYRIENMPFEALLPQMQFGTIDIIAAGMSPTPERAARILFSSPYLEADPLAIVTLSGSSIKTLDDLNNKVVAVNQGYVADMQLSKHTAIKLLRLPSISDALLALTYGKAEAFVTGGRTVKPLQDRLGSDKISVHALTGLDESTALGISKNKPALAEKINSIIKELYDDGTLEQLKEKWHIQ